MAAKLTTHLRGSSSTFKKPAFCAEWKTIIPDVDTESWSPKFFMKCILYQLVLNRIHGDHFYLDLMRVDGVRIEESYTCTVLTQKDLDLKSASSSSRKRVKLGGYQVSLWDSAIDIGKLQNKEISFLVVIEEEGGESKQENEDGNNDWCPSQESLNALCGDYSKLLEDRRNADITILCGEQTITAHANILSARSHVFDKMLNLDMAERRTGIIQIPDIEPEIIKDFLKYLYSGTLPEMTFIKASLLYEASDKYNVRSLLKDCQYHLGKMITLDNAFDILILADQHSDHDLRKLAMDFISTEEIPQHKEMYTEFSDRHPKLANEAVLNAYQFLKEKQN